MQHAIGLGVQRRGESAKRRRRHLLRGCFGLFEMSLGVANDPTPGGGKCDVYPAPVARVRATLYVAGMGQAVDDRGEGAGAHEHALGQFARHQLAAGVGEVPQHDGLAETEPEMICYGLTESLSGQQKGAQLADGAFGIGCRFGCSGHGETTLSNDLYDQSNLDSLVFREVSR